MAGASDQQLLREVLNAIQPRGLRHAAHDQGDDAIPRVFVRQPGTSVPGTSGKTYICIELDDAVVTKLDEKMFGEDIEDGVIPVEPDSINS